MLQTENWLAMSGQFNDRLLTTVWAMIGSTITIFIGLLGYSWFINNRMYEKDKTAMLAEVMAQVESYADEAVKKAGLVNRLDFMELDVLELNSARWEAQGVFANAIRFETKRGELGLRRNADWIVESSVARVETLLNKFTRLDSLRSSFEPELLAFLEKVPPSCASMKTRIVRKLEGTSN